VNDCKPPSSSIFKHASFFLPKIKGFLKKNLGMSDRVIRVVLAIAIAYFTGLVTRIVATTLIVLAAAIVITGSIGWCPVYLPFGLNTYVSKKDREKKG